MAVGGVSAGKEVEVESGSSLVHPVPSYPVIFPGWSWPVPFARYQTIWVPEI